MYGTDSFTKYYDIRITNNNSKENKNYQNLDFTVFSDDLLSIRIVFVLHEIYQTDSLQKNTLKNRKILLRFKKIGGTMIDRNIKILLYFAICQKIHNTHSNLL